MEGWLSAATDYIARWIAFQREHFDQPGVSLAVVAAGRPVLTAAFGSANLATGEALTPAHRFRVASHSKSFTAAGILLLKDRGRLRLDDPAGRHVPGLHPEVAEATLAQLMSHSAGLVRDGADAGQFSDERPFLDRAQLMAGLAEAPVLPAATRFKYSNHGFGLLGLVIEAVTGEAYNDWIAREVVAAAGLADTFPDIAAAAGGPLAAGHSGRMLTGRRLIIPGDNPTHAMASATGFVSTPGDLARFFAQLSPAAADSILSPASRREMTRRHWRDRETALERHYGLGTIGSQLGEWEAFGHSGSFQGTLSRTAMMPGQDLCVSVVTNAIDGMAHVWLEGAVAILRAYRKAGAPTPEAADWAGRWWTMWSAVDLVPMGARVLACHPALPVPLSEASELALTGRDTAIIEKAPGFASPGEPARRERAPDGSVAAVWLAGGRLWHETVLRERLLARYAG